MIVIRLTAMRVAGSDFFCGLTFPVEDSFCSLIIGGWGRSLVGIYNVEGADASENETTQFINFEARLRRQCKLISSANSPIGSAAGTDGSTLQLAAAPLVKDKPNLSLPLRTASLKSGPTLPPARIPRNKSSKQGLSAKPVRRKPVP